MTAIAERRPRPLRVRLPALRAEHAVIGAALAVLALLTLPTLVALVRSSVVVGERLGRAGTLSLEAYADIVTSPSLVPLVANTFLFAAGSTAVGLLLGGALAWCVERTDAPLKALAYAAIVVSLAVPGILRTIGWIFLIGPRTGAVNEAFRSLTGSADAAVDVFTLPAMVFVEGVFWVPLVFLLVSSSLRSMDPSLEEAAALSGGRPAYVLRRVTAGLALPGILAVVLLTFIRSVQAFEVPLLLGVPARVRVLTTEVYLSVQSTIVPEYSFASAYGVLLLVVLAVAIVLYARATRSATRFATITGKAFRPRIAKLGRGRALAGAYVLAVVALQVLPVLYLVYASFLPTFGLEGAPWANLTLRNYEKVLADPRMTQSITNSLVIGAVSASIVMLVGALAAWAMVRTRLPGRGLIDQLGSLPLVFPGIVLGVAALGLYLRSPVPVYGTIWIFVLAYATGYLPYGLRYLHPGILRIHPELEESARVSGARWGTAFRRVVVPLLVPSIVAGWTFVFLLSVRELSVAALLWTPRSPVVATTMLDLWTNGNVNQVSAFGTIVAGLSMAFALAAYRFGRRFGIAPA